MSTPTVLGFTGVAGAGKDTAYERLEALAGSDVFQRRSVADPLKESVAALFGSSLEQLEEWKRNPDAFVGWGIERPDEPGCDGLVPSWTMTWRELMQRYGTEAHRGIFGDDFWLDQWRDYVDAHQDVIVVNTSVRFENEARAILERGGEVWHIDGPQDAGAGGHESEQRLPDELITRVIDNTVRMKRQVDMPYDATGAIVPNFDRLDTQLAAILGEWS